ncbi:MAG: sensor histidine kinase [Bacteroidota bacterium]
MKNTLILLGYVLFHLSSSFLWGQQNDESLAEIAVQKDIIRAAENPESVIDAYNELSWIFFTIPLPDSAIAMATVARSLASEIEYTKGLGDANMRLGAVNYSLGKYLQSIPFYKRALDYRTLIPDSVGMAGALHNLGVQYKNLGHFELAATYFEKGLALAEAKDNQDVMVDLCNSIGILKKNLGQTSQALLYFERALRLEERLTGKRKPNIYINIGNLHEQTDNYPLAIESYQTALRLSEEMDRSETRQTAWYNLGVCYFKMGRMQEAKNFLKKGLENPSEAEEAPPIPDQDGLYRNILGDLYLEEKRYDSARFFFAQYLEQSEEKQKVDGIAESYYKLGLLEVRQEHPQAALTYGKLSLKNAEAIQVPGLIVEANNLLAQIYAELGSFEQALAHQQAIQQLQDSLSKLKINGLVELNQFEIQDREKFTAEKSAAKLAATQASWLQKFLFLAILTFMALTILVYRNNLIARKAHDADRKSLEAESARYAAEAAKLEADQKSTQAIAKKEMAEKEASLAKARAKQSQLRIDDMLKGQELDRLYTKIEAQERERKRIAKELHDGLGATLATVQMFLESIDFSKNPLQVEQSRQYDKANHLLTEACQDVRTISRDMYNNYLMKFGLVAAIQNHITKINQTNKVVIHFYDHGISDRLTDKLEVNAFRIVQELLSNALKHAEAQEITVTLTLNGNNLNIMVEDDGIGFDSKKAFQIGDGMGLNNIKARLQELGGSLDIDSGKGNGTTFNLDIPLKPSTPLS